MNLLVLDTSTDRAAVGLLTNSGAIYTSLTGPDRRHGRDLIPSLRALLREAGVVLRDLDLLAVGVGPGSYTGLRVGVMAAKTLAYATGSSLVGLDSLEAVARNAPASASRISVVADAQRGDVYVADFCRVPASETVVLERGSRIESLANWRAALQPGVLVIGPGLEWPAIRAAVPPALLASDSSLDYPHGHGLIELACDAWASGRRDDLWRLEPRYLRRSAAEDKWDAHGESPAV
jgi:tRNA threonylcarbamoyladenosine biosynthesis protein TsaB